MAYRVVQYKAKAEPVPLGAKETITPDKWVGEGPDLPARRLSSFASSLSCLAFVPVITAAAPPIYVGQANCEPIAVQQFQYPTKAEPVTVPLAGSETVTVDKWQRAQSEPLRTQRLIRAANGTFAVVSQVPQVYISPQSAEPTFIQSFQYEDRAGPIAPIAAGAETITLDKWNPGQVQPYLKVRRATYFPSTRDSRSLLLAESSTIDKWLGNRIDPPLPSKRSQWLYPVRVSDHLFNVPAVSSPIFIGGQFGAPISVISFQYDGDVKPLVPIVAAPETITVDKWNPVWPHPYFRLKRLIQYGVNCAIAEQADDGLPPVQWMPPTNRPYPYRREAAREGYSVTPRLHVVPPPETVFLDKWAQQTNRPRFDLKRQQYVYPVRVSDQMFNVPTPPQVPAVYINGQGTDPIRVVSFQYDSAEPLRVITVENLTIDKWDASYPDLLFRLQRAVEGQRVVDPRLLTQPESAFVDKWGQSIQVPRFDLKRTQNLYPAFSSDAQLFTAPGAEIIRLDKWGKNHPDLVFRSKRLADYTLSVIDARLLTQLELAAIDKWGQPTNRPRFDLKRQQSIYPPFTADAQLYIQPGVEIIRPDKWAGNYPSIINRSKRLGDYGYFTIDPRQLTQGERTSVDKWWQPTQIPTRDLKRLRRLEWIYPNLSFVVVVVPLTAGNAVWQNLATVTLNAADLETVTLLVEHLGDPGTVMFQDNDIVVIVSDDTDIVGILSEDNDVAIINYEDNDIA